MTTSRNIICCEVLSDDSSPTYFPVTGWSQQLPHVVQQGANHLLLGGPVLECPGGGLLAVLEQIDRAAEVHPAKGGYHGEEAVGRGRGGGRAGKGELTEAEGRGGRSAGSKQQQKVIQQQQEKSNNNNRKKSFSNSPATTAAGKSAATATARKSAATTGTIAVLASMTAIAKKKFCCNSSSNNIYNYFYFYCNSRYCRNHNIYCV